MRIIRNHGKLRGEEKKDVRPAEMTGINLPEEDPDKDKETKEGTTYKEELYKEEMHKKEEMQNEEKYKEEKYEGEMYKGEMYKEEIHKEEEMYKAGGRYREEEDKNAGNSGGTKEFFDAIETFEENSKEGLV